MDADRFDALARTLSSTSRRRALGRFAGAALGAVVLGGASPPSAQAAANLKPGWTHLAGTAGCLVVAKPGGNMGFRPFVDGRAGPLDNGIGGKYVFAHIFTHLAGVGNVLAKYDRERGTVTYERLADACYPAAEDGQSGFGKTWTHIVGIATNVLFFYDTANGAWAGGRLGPTGVDDEIGFEQGASGNFGADWTHVVAAGRRVLFYHRSSGLGQTASVDDLGGLTQGQSYPFGAGWTHVAGTRNAGLLCYNRTTGKGMTGRLDAEARWSRYARNIDFGTGWTHVTGAGARSLLFYNKRTGKGVGGYLTDAGQWRKTTTYG
jgi:hypothetical protein